MPEMDPMDEAPTEGLAYLEAILPVVQAQAGLNESEMITRAADTPSYVGETFTPPPMTAHPALARQADAMRQMIASGYGHIRLPTFQRAEWFFDSDLPAASASLPEPVTFTVRKAHGAMPFVGPMYERWHYVWRVAVDPYGRHVAGPADIVRQDMMAWPSNG